PAPVAGLSPRAWAACCGCAWAVVLVVCCGRPLLTPRAHSVYWIFADAGRRWASGADLYPASPDPFRYCPGIAALFVPFSLLPEGRGGGLWRALNAAVFLGGLAWFGRVCLGAAWRPPLRAVFALFTLPLAVSSCHNGQINPLMTGLMLAGV